MKADLGDQLVARTGKAGVRTLCAHTWFHLKPKESVMRIREWEGPDTQRINDLNEFWEGVRAQEHADHLARVEKWKGKSFPSPSADHFDAVKVIFALGLYAAFLALCCA